MINIANIEDLKNKIFNEDSFETLKKIPDKSINLAIYDVPYFSTNIKEVGDKQWKSENEYIDWCISLFKETQRVLKDNGSFYFFHKDINIMVEILYRIKHETSFRLKNQITWDKLETGNQDFLMPLYKNSKLKRKYATSLTEYIYYFTFDDSTGLSRVMLDVDNFKQLKEYSKEIQNFIGLKLKQINKRLGNRRSEHFFYHSSTQWNLCTEEVYSMLVDEFKINKYDGYRTYSDLKNEYDNLRIKYECKIKEYEQQRYTFIQPYLITPKDIEKSKNVIRPYSTVWHYSRDEEVYDKHLTPKPLEMIKHIINTSSKEGDVIYDGFMGSGTTAAGCLETNRNYIGSEINSEYIENIINPRVKEYIIK